MSVPDTLKAAQNKAARYCAYAERAPKQVIKKLLEWGLEESETSLVISELKNENFLNEERFARAYCHDKFEFNRWGKNKIRNHLSALDLSPEIIETGLSVIEYEKYHQVLEQLTHKKWQSLSREPNNLKKQQKTAAFLLNKGFEHALIWPIVRLL